MNMKTKIVILALSVFVIGTAYAGRRSTYVTTVDTANRTAYGDVMSARSSAGANAFIGCTVLGFSSGSSEAICSAGDASGVTAYCYSQAPAIIQAASVSGSSTYYYFQWDASSQCTYVYASNESVYGPLQP